MNKILLFILFTICITNAQLKNSSYNLSLKDDDVKISWLKDTASVSYYELERKTSRFSTWQQIYSAGVENKKKFTYVDSDLSGEKYSYRIKSIMKDGSVRYSEIMEVELNSLFRFTLKQNFPNPFNPETKIAYSIPQSGYVELKIYNLLGQEIETLISEFKEAGEYSVNFNAGELNSGLYIYKLISGDKVLTRKMTLIK